MGVSTQSTWYNQNTRKLLLNSMNLKNEVKLQNKPYRKHEPEREELLRLPPEEEAEHPAELAHHVHEQPNLMKIRMNIIFYISHVIMDLVVYYVHDRKIIIRILETNIHS